MVLFRREKSEAEVGRYVWGRTGISVLDTADGTVYFVEKMQDNDSAILEVHTTAGFIWRKKNKINDL